MTKQWTPETPDVDYKNSTSMVIVEQNPLASICKVAFRDDFVVVRGECELHIDKMPPRMYATVLKDMQRGYRTEADSRATKVEDAILEYLKWDSPNWKMSYIGRAKFQVYLPERLIEQIYPEVKALGQMLDKEFTVERTSRYIYASAPVTMAERKNTWSSRRVPKVAPQYAQIRPILEAALMDQALTDARARAVAIVKEKRRLNLSFSYR